jgi:hypothetical protein
MTEIFNPVSTSGIGFKFEHYVQASFLASLLLETPIPFEQELTVEELKFQAKHEANTDDLIVRFGQKEKAITYYVQCKKGLQINNNETFDEVIGNAWKDFNSNGFETENSKFIITTDFLSRKDNDDSILVLEWARTSTDWDNFYSKIKKNKQKGAKLSYFLKAIDKIEGKKAEHDRIWKFLRLIIIKPFDFLDSASKDKEMLKWFIRPFLKQGNDPQSVLLSILAYIETCNQTGATINKVNADASIKDLFELSNSASIKKELREFLLKSSSQLRYTLHNKIDGFHLDRVPQIDSIMEISGEKTFTIITGEGGVGKSGLAKDYIETIFQSENGFLFFKADQFDRSSLAHTLSDLGVTSSFEYLISQWMILPKLVIYIDSFEKLYESSHNEAFLEFLGEIKHANNIKIVATCRSFAIETLRIKYRLDKDEIGLVNLQPLNNDQLELIGKNRPKLKVIISNPKLKKLISLPFYLNIAAQIIDSISSEGQIDEQGFKKALWENIVEKKGSITLGASRARANVFSNLIIERATQKIPFVKPDTSLDDNVIANLETDGLLIKSPKLDAYAPAHDIFEDIVVTNHLNDLFYNKINNQSFLESVDNNPVFRRVIRLWIQELIISLPKEARLFLSDIFNSAKNDVAIIDEILIGILGSPEAYQLIKCNAEIFLRENLKLFYKSFMLLKIVFIEPFSGENPERSIRTLGPGWSALLKILDENYENHKERFEVILLDLLKHWVCQFSIDDALPIEAEIVAKYCVIFLKDNSPISRLFPKKVLLEILACVSPVMKEKVEEFIKKAIEGKAAKTVNLDYDVSVYKDLFKLILIETFRCVPFYKICPDLVVELAKLEWYSYTSRNEYDTSYRESSFGLVKYKYDYFSPSAFQTPFRYLFRYHPKVALHFLIELCNRGIEFYKLSEYFVQNGAKEIEFPQSDGTVINLLGDGNLWKAYRGQSLAPYLIESSLMAFEVHLLESIATNSIDPDLFDNITSKSNSVLLLSVLASAAMDYPLAFGKKVLSLFKERAFFLWDLGRFAEDTMGSSATTIGNDPYYTRERYLSNQLKFRKTNLEHLVSKLQFYYPIEINKIIDDHKMTADKTDHAWLLALTRMDMRNTTLEILENENMIRFNPNPLSQELQDFVEEGSDDSQKYLDYMSLVMWANKAFKNEHNVVITIDEWRNRFEISQTKSFKVNQPFGDISKSIAAIGIRDFLIDLSFDEKKIAVDLIGKDLNETSKQLKTGYLASALDVFYKADFSILPILLKKDLIEFVDVPFAKQLILDFLILLPPEDKEDLIHGIRSYLWEDDPAFSKQCFELLLKLAREKKVNKKIFQLRYSLRDDLLIIQIDKIISEVVAVPRIDLNTISIINDNQDYILYSLKILPYARLNTDYINFFQRIILQVNSLPDSRESVDDNIKSGLQTFVAEYLLANANDSGQAILLTLLSMYVKQAKFVNEILKVIVWTGHDRNYPPEMWTHFHTIFKYVFTESALIGLIKILLLHPLSNPQNVNKLNEDNPGKKIHEVIISEFAKDGNLIGPIFKLLSGAGANYQPSCLNWLKNSLPDANSLSLITSFDKIYLELFVEQLHTNHIEFIQRNRELFEYYIMLLNVLVGMGSSLAFRIRDVVI